MATLIVRRPNDMAGRFRRLKVFVDGQKTVGLRPNKEVSLDMPPGGHEVSARMDWARSPGLEVILSDTTPTTIEVSLPFAAGVEVFTQPRRAVKIRSVPSGEG